MTDLTRLRQLVAHTGPVPDTDLLARFAASRDEPAFAALVRRHGPMVLAVCRRVLRHRQDAEDAFQATFLVLARRAGALGPRPPLGSWLYGVAYRTALGARRAAAVRREREGRAAGMRPEAASPDDASRAPELRDALDRELAALPAVYRAAVMACHLEGLPRREAAARLGWTEGTLSSRLARARSLLARRLTRHGLALPAAGLGIGVQCPVLAAALATPTIRLCVLVAAGEAAVAAPVAVLVEGTMRSMFLTKLRAAVAVATVVAAVAAVSAAGWRANAVVAQPLTGAGAAGVQNPQPMPPRSDKERIAELELERDRLLEELKRARERSERLTALVLRYSRLLEDARTELARLENVRRDSALAGLLQPADPEPKVVAPMPAPPPRACGEGDAPAPPIPTAVRLYRVGDLARDEKEGDALVKVVRATVTPKSWGEGAGVEFLPLTKVLVVRQTGRGHEEVAELLKLLRPPQMPQHAPPVGR